MAFWLGIILFLFGAVVPPLLFPNENQILVGFIGAPFILIGITLLLIASFPTRRLPDKPRSDKEKKE
jgi:hypothetical protein